MGIRTMVLQNVSEADERLSEGNGERSGRTMLKKPLGKPVIIAREDGFLNSA
jgi:hypothetical protein